MIEPLRKWPLAIACMAWLLLFSGRASANPLATWSDILIPPSIYGVKGGEREFVAVGEGGLLLAGFGSEPESWSRLNSGTDDDLFGITLFDGKFYAVGAHGTILESPTIVQFLWNRFQIGNVTWNDVHGASEALVSVGESGSIATKLKEGLWQLQTSPTTNTLRGVTEGSGTWVAVGAEGTILLSTNRVSWRLVRSEPGVMLTKIAYGNGNFVTVSPSSGRILKSSSGDFWDAQTVVAGAQLYGVAYENSRFVAVGRHEGKGLVLESRDAMNWSVYTNVTGTTLYCAAFRTNVPTSNFDRKVDTFVAFGERGASASSTNNNPWLRRTEYRNGDSIWNDVIHANGTFVAVGQTGNLIRGAIASSEDGGIWRYENIYDGPILYGVAHGDGRFVAIGGHYASPFPPPNFVRLRSTATSRDGRTWTPAQVSETVRLQSVAYGNGLFVAAGMEPGLGSARLVIVSSPDGSVWTTRFDKPINVPGPPNLGVAYGNGLFVVAGPGIHSSTDAVNWTQRHTAPLNDVIFGNGQFVVYGQTDLLTSTNAINWRPRGNGWGTSASAFGNGIFMLGSFSAIQWSLDGVSWTQSDIGNPTRYLTAVGYGNGRFLALARGSAFQSGVVAQFLIDGVRRTPDGTVSLPLGLVPNQVLQVDSSSDLRTWTPSHTATNVSANTEIQDRSAAGSRQRFYRAKLLPAQQP